ncbi:MAG: DNA internalization-related competence protein ComEC/Rec2 [Oscillospiraceae bacterium]|jgi:competence protein ComEC|nr:DNA internalization-related competence protein ComEC/Rec2 [Oscillospiraceae bacterium]
MRLLATASAALASAVFLAHYALPAQYYFWAAVLCAILALLGLLLQGTKRQRALLICLGAAAGFLVSGVSYAQRTAPCIEASGKTLSFEAEVAEYPVVYENYTYVTVKLRGGGPLPRVRAQLNFFRGDEAPDVTPGDYISVTAEVSYSGELFGERYDKQTSKNIHLTCYPEEVTVTGRSSWAFLYFPQDIARAVNKTAKEIFPGRTAAFMTALLTGDTRLFYEDTELSSAMTRTGTLHVVSVSGMHVAFLIGFLRLLIRRRRTASLVGLPIIWVFAFVAGATPSILRAAFMYSCVLAAPLVKRESDSITALTAVLALLLLINPDAAGSLSLQLSFSAMLGLVLVTPRLNNALTRRMKVARKDRKKSRGGNEGKLYSIGYKLLYAVISAFSASVGALVFSTPVSAYYFGYVATYGIIVNILIFWAISLCFVLGYISCFLGMLWLPIGLGGGAVTGVLVNYIIEVTGFFSGLPMSQVFVTNGWFLGWIIFTYALFGFWFFWRRERAFRPIIPISLTLSGLFLGMILLQVSVGAKNENLFTAVDVGQGQSIVLISGRSAVVIDCGGGGKTDNAGKTVSAYLLSRGIDSVAALCVTHFDADHVNGAVQLMANLKVQNLVVAPASLEDAKREEILAYAQAHETVVHVIEDTTRLTLGELSVTALKPVSRLRPELIYLARLGNCDILVTGDADLEAEARLLLTQELPDLEIFVAGHHGSATSSSEELLGAIDAEVAVISSGYNSYGHPTPEALGRFRAAGMELLRTDELGSVEIRITGEGFVLPDGALLNIEE